MAARKNTILPGEASLSVRVRHVVLSVVFTGAALAGFTGILGTFDVLFFGSYYLIEAQYFSLRDVQPVPDVLIFGDSSGLYGIHPETVADSLDASVRNACLMGLVTSFTDAGIAERIIRQTGKPRVLVFTYAVGALEETQDFREAGYLGLGLSYYLPVFARMPVVKAVDAALFSAWPLYRDRSTYAKLFKRFWESQDVDYHRRYYRIYRNAAGGILIPDDERNVAEIERFRRHYDEMYQDGLQPSIMAELGLPRIAALSREQKLHTFFALGPIDSTYASRPGFRDYLARHIEHLRQLTDNEPYLHLLSTQPVYIRESDLYDSIMHPCERGTRYYSTRLAAQIDSACTTLGVDLGRDE